MRAHVLAALIAAGCGGAAATVPSPAAPVAAPGVAPAVALSPVDAFYERVKAAVFKIWDPDTVWRLIDPTNTTYGPKPRVTQLKVTLSPAGVLTDLEVAVSSGVFDLDQEAVRAFRRAAPFVDPPTTMLQSDHQITFDFSLVYVVHKMYPAKVANQAPPAAADAPAAGSGTGSASPAPARP